jgi:hypothetical protein
LTGEQDLVIDLDSLKVTSLHHLKKYFLGFFIQTPILTEGNSAEPSRGGEQATALGRL